MGNVDSRSVCATHERIHNHQALDSNIAHRTSDFEFFSKLLARLRHSETGLHFLGFHGNVAPSSRRTSGVRGNSPKCNRSCRPPTP
jgi:hypothetical protein